MSGQQSKVIGISIKDRSSILPAGHMADAAYWFDNDSQHFVTSDYYMKQLPAWVAKVNADAVTAGQGNPGYAYCVGVTNDPGAITVAANDTTSVLSMICG